MVEDNIDNQKLAERMLEKLGSQVDVAENGRQAIEMLEEASYSLVFMDCQMPVMDGYEATAHIRKLDREIKRVPIIALTAHAMKGDRERCLEAGMDDYISKPVNKKTLQIVLERWLPKQS